MGRRKKEFHPIALAVYIGCVGLLGGGFLYSISDGELGLVLMIVGGLVFFGLVIFGLVKIFDERSRISRNTQRTHSEPAHPTKYEEIDISYITQLEGAELNHDAIEKILRQEKKDLEDSRMLMGKTYTIEGVRIENGRVKVHVESIEEYRTVERYVQRNYIRTPIYSEPKFKRHKIEKSFKLTNAELEALNGNSEFILSRFSHEIITLLGNPLLVPSWYIEEVLRKWEKEIGRAVVQANKTADEIKISVSAKAQRKINALEPDKEKTEKKLDKLYKKRNGKNNVSIKLNEKIENAEAHLREINEQIAAMKERIAESENISKHNKDIYAEQWHRVNEICADLAKKIKKLPTDVASEEAGFMLLNDLQKMERQKIIGVYVIRNRKNARCYVGQSKDVMRRLNQHFKGTEPKNIIFAEDYYSAPAEERESLFEIKVIPLYTKDELDSTEKNLIEEYEAFTTGYNGTSGNT